MQGAACALAILSVSGCSPSSPEPTASTPPPPAGPPPPADVLSFGQSIYEAACATCHYDGKASDKAPVLLNSKLLASQDDVIAGILKGRKTGFIVNGIAPGMPPQASLSNEDIAAVVTYVRHTFGNINQLTTEQDVEKLR